MSKTAKFSVLWVLTFAFLYSLLSFLWSFTGFLSPATPVHYHEYSLSGLATEVSGHFLFGALVGLASGRIGLTALAGAEAVLIDSDHLLASFGFPVMGRLSHSIPFSGMVAVAFLFLPQKYVARRTIAVVALGATLSHFSYDVLAGDGQFPLLAPFSTSVFGVAFWAWPILEAAGIFLVFSTRFLTAKNRPAEV